MSDIKTLQQIKDEVAVKHGYACWNEYLRQQEAHNWSLRYCYSPQSEVEPSAIAYDSYMEATKHVLHLHSLLKSKEARIKELEEAWNTLYRRLENTNP